MSPGVELANRLMHPRFEVEREYAIRIRGLLVGQQLDRLREGIPLADGDARVESIEEERPRPPRIEPGVPFMCECMEGNVKLERPLL